MDPFEHPEDGVPGLSGIKPASASPEQTARKLPAMSDAGERRFRKKQPRGSLVGATGSDCQSAPLHLAGARQRAVLIHHQQYRT